MNVTTGFGYYTKNGKIIGKYELPVGEHPLSEGIDYVEVANRQVLDVVKIDNLAANEFNGTKDVV